MSRAIKRQNLRQRYGLSLERFDEMVAEQGGLCAICEQALPLVVDHNHETGTVRALLCQPCNMGIGGLQDDIAILLRAMEYLNDWNT